MAKLFSRFRGGFRSLASGDGSGGGGAPAAHASSHLGGGSDAISVATTSVNGLMAATSLLTLDRLHGRQALAAAGANQGAATAIGTTGNFVEVTSGTTGQGIRLPAAPVVGDSYLIKINESVSSNPLPAGAVIALYPGTGGKFSHRAINTALNISAYQSWLVHCIVAGGAPIWEALPINGMVAASEISHSLVENFYGGQNYFNTMNIYASTQHFGDVSDIWTGATGQNKVQFPDNLAEAYWIGEATNRYIRFVSTNGGESVAVDKTLVATTDALVGGRLLKYGYDIFDGTAYAGSATAFAGGGQASATTAALGVTFVTTVASAGDSVKLPAAAGTASALIEVWNEAINTMDLFPPSGGTINGGAPDAAISVPGGTLAYCRNRGASGTWLVKLIS